MISNWNIIAFSIFYLSIYHNFHLYWLKPSLHYKHASDSVKSSHSFPLEYINHFLVFGPYLQISQIMVTPEETSQEVHCNDTNARCWSVSYFDNKVVFLTTPIFRNVILNATSASRCLNIIVCVHCCTRRPEFCFIPVAASLRSKWPPYWPRGSEALSLRRRTRQGCSGERQGDKMRAKWRETATWARQWEAPVWDRPLLPERLPGSLSVASPSDVAWVVPLAAVRSAVVSRLPLVLHKPLPRRSQERNVPRAGEWSPFCVRRKREWDKADKRKEGRKERDTRKRLSRQKKIMKSHPGERETVIRKDILPSEEKHDKGGTVRQLHGQSSSMQRHLCHHL